MKRTAVYGTNDVDNTGQLRIRVYDDGTVKIKIDADSIGAVSEWAKRAASLLTPPGGEP